MSTHAPRIILEDAILLDLQPHSPNAEFMSENQISHDILRPTPENPAPDNYSAGYFAGHRGVKIRYGLFRSDIVPARGTIVLLQGRNEFIEKYFETIRHLNAMGLWVATYDLRGQGGSDRLKKDARKGHVRRFSDYEKDLEIFLEQVVLPDARLPFFLVAHSTGALIALSFAPRLSNRISWLALASPFVGFLGQPES
jgi:lysophospholipase